MLVINPKKRKTPNVMESRCGCEAHIVVNLCSDKKYRIHSMVEEHNHGFVSPDKRHLLRSNRKVSERVKSNVFNCHKASIGMSQAFRLLQVSDGGFQNIGCTLRDLKNYCHKMSLYGRFVLFYGCNVFYGQ
jgi:zinc finger SWIM domain-containing protein 3